MSLYTDRGAHYFHTPKAGGESIAVIRPRSGGRSSNSESSISGLFAAGSRPLRAGVPTLQDRLLKELKLAGITDIEAANAFMRRLSAGAQRPFRD